MHKNSSLDISRQRDWFAVGISTLDSFAFIMKTEFKLGERVLLSPYLTHKPDWVEGVIVDIVPNPFHGFVITAETSVGESFFQREDPDYFRKYPVDV